MKVREVEGPDQHSYRKTGEWHGMRIDRRKHDFQRGAIDAPPVSSSLATAGSWQQINKANPFAS